jgi:aminoglycoside phosphotransferase (APT) family kinase protein
MKPKKNVPATQVKKFRDLARFVVAHHFGSRPARLKALAGGLSNFVFEAAHREGDFIVRISPDKARLNTFIKEHWVEREARRAGVPTAEILETGASIIPFPYAVGLKATGSPGVDHPEREKIVRELGRLAKKINSIRTHGFGETFDWSNNQLSHNTSLKDYLTGEYGYRSKIETLARSGLVSKKTTAALARVFREMLKLTTRPSLSHGDLRLKNVLADESGRITAIIDWEKATSNIAPAWELSLALHDLGIDQGQIFLEGYGLTAKKLADALPHIKAFNMLNYMPEIDRAAAAKDKPALARLHQRFAGTFDLFSLGC